MKFNDDIIEAFGYITPKLTNMPTSKIDLMSASDYARLNSEIIDVYGIQPSLFNATLDEFLVPYW